MYDDNNTSSAVHTSNFCTTICTTIGCLHYYWPFCTTIQVFALLFALLLGVCTTIDQFALLFSWTALLFFYLHYYFLNCTTIFPICTIYTIYTVFSICNCKLACMHAFFVIYCTQYVYYSIIHYVQYCMDSCMHGCIDGSFNGNLRGMHIAVFLFAYILYISSIHERVI